MSFVSMYRVTKSGNLEILEIKDPTTTPAQILWQLHCDMGYTRNILQNIPSTLKFTAA